MALAMLPGAHLVLQAFGKTCRPTVAAVLATSRPFGGGFFVCAIKKGGPKTALPERP